MKTKALVSLLLSLLSGCLVVLGQTSSPIISAEPDVTRAIVAETVLSLADFGAIGDGVTDAGPALQNALNALGDAGGGTLLVPAGRYAIVTPVRKDFSGLASDITILGVESLTLVPPPNSTGDVLTRGLDLTSEFAPRTGEQGIALNIIGLQSFLIKDITFIGTPGVDNDALITLALTDISEAKIRHCEFYGLSSLVGGGAIIQALRSNLRFEQSVVLGSTCASGVRSPIIQNLEWKGITISEAVLVDYGQRAELYSKMNTAAPYSWINIGNAAAPDNHEPRREVVIRSVFLDEGGFFGISSVPHFYTPPSAPIDLLYISGLYMNVSNFGTTGHHLDGLQRVLIEKSHYGWSHDAGSAIHLLSVGNAILDQVECVASADRIRAEAATGKLTVVNSVYTSLDSQSPVTRVVNTENPEDDPVQYVRQQFMAMLGRDPDPAAHFYWSDQLLQCEDNVECVDASRAALGAYLANTPSEKFAVSGRLVDETGAGMAAVTVTLSGSLNLTTATDTDGRYEFSNLPTSGIYTVTPSRRHYTINPAGHEIITPAGDQTFNYTATFNLHDISGFVANAAGEPLADVTVTLAGSENMTATTGANGEFLFADLPAGGNYVVTPRKTSYTFSPANVGFNDLDVDQNLNFTSSFVTFTIAGKVVDINNGPIASITITLSGGQNRATSSDSNGNFFFTDLPSEFDYTVTPTMISYSFSPASMTYNSLNANQYHAYVLTYTTHSISGRVTHDGAALSGASIDLSGYTSGTATSDANGNYSFPALPRGGDYVITVSKRLYSFTPSSLNFSNLLSNQTANFSVVSRRFFVFSAGQYTVAEGLRTLTVTVNRVGEAPAEDDVIYWANDGSADQRSDVIPVMGRLSFAPNETSKTFTVFITDDSYVEGNESITLELGDELGEVFDTSAAATLTITDNDTSQTAPNPIDGSEFFVRQHYRDFLNRSADAAGLAFWSNQITSCGTNAACIADRRMNVSAAFFLSIEFQETGFFVYRVYQASFAHPPQHLAEFLLDTRTIGAGVVVNAPGWQQLLDANTTAFIENFVERNQFTETYPLSLTPAEFVNLLNAKTGGALSPDAVLAAVAEFQGAADTDSVPARGRALRRVVENGSFSQNQLNPAFVLMQYFGYLQRNPADPPDENLDGYSFWLNKLNEFGGDFRRAEMVKSFLVSTEYRARFGTP